jgi:hypothetical protein
MRSFRVKELAVVRVKTPWTIATAATALAAAAAFGGCSGAVAPTSDVAGSVSSGDAEKASGKTTKATGTAAVTGGDYRAPIGPDGETNTDPFYDPDKDPFTNDGGTEAGTDSGLATDDGGTTGSVGSVTGETTSVSGFVGRSAYAVHTGGPGASLTLTVLDADFNADYLTRRIKSYTCEPCGSADPHCRAGGQALSVTFLPAPDGLPGNGVSAAGFPTSANYSLSGNALADGVSVAGFGATAATSGTLRITGALPAKEGDRFDAAINVTLANGATYKATIGVAVFAPPPAGATPPQACDNPSQDGKWAKPVFE